MANSFGDQLLTPRKVFADGATGLKVKTGAHILLVLVAFGLLSCGPGAEEPASPKAATRASPPTPDPEETAVARAVELTKRSLALKYVDHDLPPGARVIGGGDPAKTDTEHSIANELRHMKGDLQIIGWAARRFDDQRFVVTYCWTLNGDTRCFPFEVNTAADLVRYIGDDQALKKKYGFH